MKKHSSSAYDAYSENNKTENYFCNKKLLKEDTAKLSCCGKKRQMLCSRLEVLDIETMTIKGMNSKRRERLFPVLPQRHNSCRNCVSQEAGIQLLAPLKHLKSGISWDNFIFVFLELLCYSLSSSTGTWLPNNC